MAIADILMGFFFLAVIGGVMISVFCDYFDWDQGEERFIDSDNWEV